MSKIPEALADAEKAPARKVTSADIKLGIRASFSSGYQTFFEVGNDTGTRVRRHADAVAIGIWPSTGHQIHGFEVKVSRADFLNEMKDPDKSQAVFRFCHRWSLATPPGLIKVDELPPNWGLVTFDGRTLRTVKQAPLLEPERITYGFVAALVRRAGEQDEAIIKAAVDKVSRELRDQHTANAKRMMQESRDNQLRQAAEAVKIVEALKVDLGEGWFSECHVPEFIAAVRTIRKSGIVASYDGAGRFAKELRRAAERIETSLADVATTPTGAQE